MERSSVAVMKDERKMAFGWALGYVCSERPAEIMLYSSSSLSAPRSWVDLSAVHSQAFPSILSGTCMHDIGVHIKP